MELDHPERGGVDVLVAAQNVAWLSALNASIAHLHVLRSVIGIVFFSRMSMLKVQGPANRRRCSTPSVPAPGLKKTWPLNSRGRRQRSRPCRPPG